MITLNFEKAKKIALDYINTNSLAEARHRNEKHLSGFTNSIPDSEWTAFLINARNVITNATGVEEIETVLRDFDAKIKANK